MYKLTVYVAEKGTQCKDGSESTLGHMWYEIENENNSKKSYGFSSGEETAVPVGRGAVHTEETENYKANEECNRDKIHKRTIEITQEQYDKMDYYGEKSRASADDRSNWFDSPGVYDAGLNSCIDFVWNGLGKAGLNPTGYEGDILPRDNIRNLERIGTNTPYDETSRFTESLMNMAAEYFKDMQLRAEKRILDVFSLFGKACKATCDPLILDLNGDGIAATTDLKNGVFFDMDNNGFAEKMAWVSSDDGLLVMDRNGDGRISNGAELFGDQTKKILQQAYICGECDFVEEASHIYLG